MPNSPDPFLNFRTSMTNSPPLTSSSDYPPPPPGLIGGGPTPQKSPAPSGGSPAPFGASATFVDPNSFAGLPPPAVPNNSMAFSSGASSVPPGAMFPGNGSFSAFLGASMADATPSSGMGGKTNSSFSGPPLGAGGKQGTTAFVEESAGGEAPTPDRTSANHNASGVSIDESSGSDAGGSNSGDVVTGGKKHSLASQQRNADVSDDDDDEDRIKQLLDAVVGPSATCAAATKTLADSTSAGASPDKSKAGGPSSFSVVGTASKSPVGGPSRSPGLGPIAGSSLTSTPPMGPSTQHPVGSASKRGGSNAPPTYSPVLSGAAPPMGLGPSMASATTSRTSNSPLPTAVGDEPTVDPITAAFQKPIPPPPPPTSPPTFAETIGGGGMPGTPPLAPMPTSSISPVPNAPGAGNGRMSESPVGVGASLSSAPHSREPSVSGGAVPSTQSSQPMTEMMLIRNAQGVFLLQPTGPAPPGSNTGNPQNRTPQHQPSHPSASTSPLPSGSNAVSATNSPMPSGAPFPPGAPPPLAPSSLGGGSLLSMGPAPAGADMPPSATANIGGSSEYGRERSVSHGGSPIPRGGSSGPPAYGHHNHNHHHHGGGRGANPYSQRGNSGYRGGGNNSNVSFSAGNSPIPDHTPFSGGGSFSMTPSGSGINQGSNQTSPVPAYALPPPIGGPANVAAPFQLGASMASSSSHKNHDKGGSVASTQGKPPPGARVPPPPPPYAPEGL